MNSEEARRRQQEALKELEQRAKASAEQAQRERAEEIEMLKDKYRLEIALLTAQLREAEARADIAEREREKGLKDTQESRLTQQVVGDYFAPWVIAYNPATGYVNVVPLAEYWANQEVARAATAMIVADAYLVVEKKPVTRATAKALLQEMASGLQNSLNEGKVVSVVVHGNSLYDFKSNQEAKGHGEDEHRSE